VVKIVLVMLYVLLKGPAEQPELVLEKVPMVSVQECQAKGVKRIDELEKNPEFAGGLYAGCVELYVQEAKK